MSTQEVENVKQVKLDFDAECPSCSATIEFNPATGKLACPYCGFETEIATPEQEEEKVAREMDFLTAEERGNFNWGVEKKTVICEACAAETIYDALQVADSCPYCGSHQVMEASAENTLAPNGVCAFEVTDKQAGEHFQKWIKGRWFTPKAAKNSARLMPLKGSIFHTGRLIRKQAPDILPDMDDIAPLQIKMGKHIRKQIGIPQAAFIRNLSTII